MGSEPFGENLAKDLEGEIPTAEVSEMLEMVIDYYRSWRSSVGF